MIVCSWLFFSSGLYFLAERLAFFAPQEHVLLWTATSRVRFDVRLLHELRASNTSIFNALRFSSKFLSLPYAIRRDLRS